MTGAAGSGRDEHSPGAPRRRWLVTGARGQLGAALVEQLRARGEAVVAHDHASLELADPAALAAALDAAAAPGLVVVNAAAWTAVDACESDPERARAVNAQAPAELARLCRERGVGLLHVSTDYVFDGRQTRAWREDDPCAPLSVYGRSKWEGECAVLAEAPHFVVVRTAWVFGRGSNFVAAICRRGAELHARGERRGLRVVEDQVGSPTWADDLAGGLLALVERGAAGLYHLANRGRATRIELARLALDHAGFGELEIEPVKTAALRLPAERPLSTVLDCGRAEALGVTLRGWREAVRAYLDSPTSPLAARGEPTS